MLTGAAPSMEQESLPRNVHRSRADGSAMREAGSGGFHGAGGTD